MFAFVDTGARFRVTGHTPELWNAMDECIEPQILYTVEDGGGGLAAAHGDIRLHLCHLRTTWRTACDSGTQGRQRGCIGRG
jgi:hypothetical protein